MTNDSSPAFLPLGYSREESGGSSLSAVKGIGPKCPECEKGHIVSSMTKQSSWGWPESPTTARCRKCGVEYTLGLKKTE